MRAKTPPLLSTQVAGHIEFRSVTFRYPSRPDAVVHDGLSFSAPAGHSVALVGDSGCGKSTAIALLERFYLPESGHVLLDGTDVADLNVNWLRTQLGLVSQEPVLFATTILENIRYGKEAASDEECHAAAKLANAFDFVSALPDGFGTEVGDRGVQMSGGQKQRVAIARAVVKDPRVMLLDEATSALDTESESVVQRALEVAMRGRTTLVIAHRLATVRHCDKIVVLHRGRVVEEGVHDDLVQRGGVYANLVNRQISAVPEEGAVAVPREGSRSSAQAPGTPARGSGSESTAVPQQDCEDDDAVFVARDSSKGSALGKVRRLTNAPIVSLLSWLHACCDCTHARHASPRGTPERSKPLPPGRRRPGSPRLSAAPARPRRGSPTRRKPRPATPTTRWWRGRPWRRRR